jgi:hypothetical protein
MQIYEIIAVPQCSLTKSFYPLNIIIKKIYNFNDKALRNKVEIATKGK